MKAKKFNKKLGLNKKTIANLGSKDLQSIKGGDLTDFNCDSENPATLCQICPTRFCLPTRIRPCE